MAAMGAPGSHEHAVRIANELLCKKEPEPARVLCWGWLLKQVRIPDHRAIVCITRVRRRPTRALLHVTGARLLASARLGAAVRETAAPCTRTCRLRS